MTTQSNPHNFKIGDLISVTDYFSTSSIGWTQVYYINTIDDDYLYVTENKFNGKNKVIPNRYKHMAFIRSLTK